MDTAFEHQVRLRAYEIWMAAGMSDGDAERHWYLAEAAVRRDDRPEGAAPKASTGRTKTGKAAVGKPAKAKQVQARSIKTKLVQTEAVA